MEYEKAAGNDKGNVVVQGTIAVADEQAPPANPQLYPYFLCLFFAGHILSVLITVGPSFSQNKDSPFKAHGGIFMIMTIVSLSLVALASLVLLYTSHYLQSWMNDFRYTVLKTVGCFSTVHALFALGAGFFVPKNLNWVVYLVMFLVFVCILAMDYVLWKYVCTHQQNKRCDTFPFHWTVLLTVLFPLAIALRPFIPLNLYKIWYLVTCACFIMVVEAGYFSFTELGLVINLSMQLGTPRSDLTRP